MKERAAFVFVLSALSLISLSSVAQQPAPEKHVKDIRAEHPWSSINASGLCDKVRAADQGIFHDYKVDPATLLPDLTALMQQSDEVILASIQRDEIDTLAPSGNDAVEYYDVTVLRSWKGPHKPGDLVTYAQPRGAISCGSLPEHDEPSLAVVTATGHPDWGHVRAMGPYVLFLRQSRGEETKLTADLRLTGGDGLQGLFALATNYNQDCVTNMRGGAEKCLAALETSNDTVKILYGRDPLKSKYHGMAVPVFLKEVQALADASSAQAARGH